MGKKTYLRFRLRFQLFLAIAFCLVVVLIQPAIAVNPSNWQTDRQKPEKIAINSVSQFTENSLLEQGNRLYSEGKLTAAVTVWQKALQIYRDRQSSTPDKLTAQLNEALCLTYLSIAYQELGEWEKAKTAIAQSVALITQELLATQQGIAIAARVSNSQGSLLLAMGQPQAALTSWKQAAAQYTQIDDEMGLLGSKINQAQALQALGLFRQAGEQLDAIALHLQKQPDTVLKALALRSLGTSLQTIGDLPKAQKTLEQSLTITQQLNSSSESSATLLSLGNNFRFIKNNDLALQKYEQAAKLAPNNMLRLEARAVQLSLLVESDRIPEAQTLWKEIEPQIVNLQPSRRNIYLRVNLADSLVKISDHLIQPQSSIQIADILTVALHQSQELQDLRAESFTIGELGTLYEKNQQLTEASKLAQRAIVLAQSMNADDLLYRWQWLLGRVLKQQGEFDRARGLYEQAIQNTQALRKELIATAPEVQFAFRDRIEPIYREFVGLLLRDDRPSQQNLIQARKTLESLQVIELENYFRSACLDINVQQIDAIDPNSAVIYSAVLSDRLAVITSLPNAPLSYHAIKTSPLEVEQTADQFLQSLNPAFSNRERFKVSQKLYDWLIRPTEKVIAEKQIQNLVFVLDSSLRNLPMSALHDGKQYAIEKYSMALTPGLQILGARKLDRSQLKVWLGGLTESRQGFTKLAGVGIEASQIAKQIPTFLELDSKFTKSSLQIGLSEQDTSIVHLATHGQFSSDPDSTFILAWDKRITVPDFYNFLRDRTNNHSTPLELLILSACKTAEGDTRATLGLAGLALRSGARSTIGSLWAVSDRSTSELMSNFYNILINQPNLSRAEVLQRSQVSLINEPKYKHPYYWAAFVLVGSWL